jgi:hypothetical protein
LNNVAVYKGTSFSAPMVSASAVNMFCLAPCISNVKIAEILRRSAKKVYSNAGANYDPITGQSEKYGYGLLDEKEAYVQTKQWIAQQGNLNYDYDLYVKDCAMDIGEQPNLVCGNFIAVALIFGYAIQVMDLTTKNQNLYIIQVIIMPT